MKLFYLFTFLVLSCSCATQAVISQDNIQEEKKIVSLPTIPEHNVQIIIRQYIPYCGGAYPSDDQLNKSAPYSGGLILINLSDSSKVDVNPEQGIVYLNLSKGNYAIKEKYKDVPFHEFYASVNHVNGNYIIQGDNECYKKWWESNLLEFEVKIGQEIQVLNGSVSSSCYTGNNPCIYYNGPYPP